MLRIKKGKDCLSVSGLKTIAIISGKEGEGVTTMAAAMASYISGIKRQRTAVVETGKGEAFKAMVHTLYGDKEMTYFKLFDIDYYYMNHMADLGLICHKEYNYVIVDFGADYKRYEKELLRCTAKVVMGSVNPWRYENYLEVCSYINKLPGSDRWLHIISGDMEDIKTHLRTKSVTGIKRIPIDNPYIIENGQLDFFEKIL
ncbi:MAG: hypothetical protein ACLRVQ_01455 [Lachnospiraceae bacterium]